MGLLDGLLGNATEVDAAKLQDKLSGVLTDSEQVARGFQVIRDLFIFTNKRLILVDKQGMTGKKAAYRSIPYRSIDQFSVETAGTFDREAELTLYVKGSGPIKKEIRKGFDIIALQRVLAEFVLR